jgi:hypothetical protein
MYGLTIGMKNVRQHMARLIDSSIDWLIDYLLFYIPLMNISLIWRRHHYQWRAAKFSPMHLWAGRDLYRATPAVTRGLGFSGLIEKTAPFSRLLRQTRGCGESILTRIVTGLYGSMKVCNYRLYHCNGHRTSKTLTSNETVEIHVTSTCLLVVYTDSKTYRM